MHISAIVDDSFEFSFQYIHESRIDGSMYSMYCIQTTQGLVIESASDTWQHKWSLLLLLLPCSRTLYSNMCTRYAIWDEKDIFCNHKMEIM